MASDKTDNEPIIQELGFEAMNLPVGGRIQFITHRTIKPIQHFSTLIGYVKDDYIIVKIPIENGAPVALNLGDKLTIRVFTGVTVCSFPCTVMRVFGRPLNYVHLSYPDKVRGTSLRTAMRVRVDVPAQLSCKDMPPAQVVLINLSVSGALIESPSQLAPDQSSVQLLFYLVAQPGNIQVPVDIKATIQNTNLLKPATETRGEIFTYGVQFIDIEPTHYTMLQNLTYEALIGDRQKIV